MLNESVGPLSRTVLSDLGAVRVQGADAVRFLQGQLSNDIALLAPDRPLLAGLHNPQGRVIAILRLVWIGADDVLAVLPRELAAGVASRLAKFVLRAKVKIVDASSEWQISGLMAAGGADERPSAVAEAARRVREGAVLARVDDDRWLLAENANSESGQWPADTTTVTRERWHSLDIASGIPQVYGATSEQFVAQMLNLDVLDAISFTKGCYTGQEVIARAHYRGRVKRRMQRFRTSVPASLAGGASGKLRDGRTFRVVDAVTLEDGRCEFLAVTQTGHGEEEATEGDAPASAASINAEQLPLPYELPP